LPEVSGHQGGVHGVLAPGFNPKDSPDMFVKKIMQNRKRIEYTIQKYEEEQKAKNNPNANKSGAEESYEPETPQQTA